MTDQELIQLLQEKPPSEFSVEEFEALRTRWTQSPELRQALIEHLHLESQLSGAFGQVDLKIDSILKRAKEVRRHTPNGRSRLWLWSAGLMVLVAVGLGFTFWSNRHQPQRMDLAQQPNEEFNSSEPVAISPEQSLGQPADALDAMVTAGIKPADPISEPKTTAVTPAKVEPEPVPDEPWTKSLARDVAPWPANSPRLTRDFKGAGHDELPELEARRWFTKIDGQPFNWGQDAYGQQQRRIARFHGFARLRAPWPKDALLRMTPFDVTDLTIYLWHGPNGLALRLYTRREPHLWAAFEVVRESSSPKPVKWGLLTTDNCGYARGGAASPQGGAGTFEIQYQDGGVTLARGGVPVMSAPLSGVPSEVFVEGQFRLRGISIHRSAPLPLIPENPHPLILGGAAAGLPWAASAEAPAELIEGPNQSADFKVDSRDKPGTFTVPIGQRGLYEVIARVDAADPGTGIFLGDLDGRPLHRVGFFKDSATGRTTIGVLRPGEHRDQANFDFNAYPPPYQTPSQWIKVVAGVGTVQILVSGDGRHWGHLLENPARDLTGAVATVGIFGLPGPAARSLNLAQLEVRSLSGLSQLANSKLIAQVPVFNGEETKDLVRWTHRMMDTQPVGIELSDWANAFALATLTRGPQRDLGVIVLKRLVAASIRSPIPVSQKLLILDEASLLCDLWDEGAARALADQYEIIAEQISAGGDHHPLATIRPAVLRSTMWSSSRLRFAWERDSSRELMRAAYGADWTDAFRTGQTEAFWNSAPHPDWIPGDRTSEIIARQSRWVRAISIENAPQLEDGQSGVLPQAWRHPLALQWNKEAYNVRAELQSALTGLTYEDACRIVMSINVSDGPGLLPDMDDRQLFVSLPTAVASAMQLHPEFARLMAEKFGPLGVIRVRQAIQSGDIRGVQAATLQFFGTEAAAEAHQWLGDRDLSAGSFPSAEEHFLLGLAHCLPRQRDGLQSRLNLAMALNGKPLPDSTGPMSAIELNGVAITAGELDSLVKSLAARPSTARRFLHAPIVAPEVLPPRSYKAESRASFDGQPGLNPGRNEFQSGDPFGKQIAFVADEQRMYVSNRLQVNAYALSGGQQWAQGLGSEQGEAHAMPFTPMSPLIAGDRLFVRRIGKGGAELACLNAENGQVLWSRRPNLQVLSDPVFWNGSLFALTLSRIDDDQVQVEGTRFDFETGAPTSTQPLFRLRDSSERSNAAQLTISGRLAVCTLAGISACFDGSGEIHWLRRHQWVPRPADDLADDFRVLPPVVEDDRVLIAVPGVRAISCMSLETGRQLWTCPLPGLRGLIQVQGPRLFADTTSGIVVVKKDNGQVAWTRSMKARLEGFQVNDRHILITQRVTVGQNKSRIHLLWLEPETGRELSQSQLEGFERPECQLGPTLFVGGKCWSLLGQGWKEAKRELIELVPRSANIPGPSEPGMMTGDWLSDATAPQRVDLALVMPGWQLEADYGSRFQIVAGDVRGEQMAVSAKLEAAPEFRLVQFIDVPTGRKTTLRLRFGNIQDRRWRLDVRANDQTLLQQIVEDSGSSNGWRDAILDLTPFAGKRVPLQLVHTPAPQQPLSDVLWKQATVVVE